jgi:hypothetical protein
MAANTRSIALLNRAAPGDLTGLLSQCIVPTTPFTSPLIKFKKINQKFMLR